MDLYGVEQGRRTGTRFEVVVVDVFQRGPGPRREDIKHLAGHEVVVPRDADSAVVDALIAASLLQLQAQAHGEVADREALTATPTTPERAGKAVGVTEVTAARIAAADVAFTAQFEDSTREAVERALAADAGKDVEAEPVEGESTAEADVVEGAR